MTYFVSDGEVLTFGAVVPVYEYDLNSVADGNTAAKAFVKVNTEKSEAVLFGYFLSEVRSSLRFSLNAWSILRRLRSGTFSSLLPLL